MGVCKNWFPMIYVKSEKTYVVTEMLLTFTNVIGYLNIMFCSNIIINKNTIHGDLIP